jgi:hypothetical protein
MEALRARPEETEMFAARAYIVANVSMGFARKASGVDGRSQRMAQGARGVEEEEEEEEEVAWAAWPGWVTFGMGKFAEGPGPLPWVGTEDGTSDAAVRMVATEATPPAPGVAGAGCGGRERSVAAEVADELAPTGARAAAGGAGVGDAADAEAGESEEAGAVDELGVGAEWCWPWPWLCACA